MTGLGECTSDVSDVSYNDPSFSSEVISSVASPPSLGLYASFVWSMGIIVELFDALPSSWYPIPASVVQRADETVF
jgi:hypothetical protein